MATATLAAAAQPDVPKAADMPTVTAGQVPIYPDILRKAHIDGTVKLRVTTDGRRVSRVDAIEGQPMLVKAATENVKTWEFDAHAAMSFDVVFRYRLLEATCDDKCRCDSLERPSTVLRLPSEVDINATEAMICDPSETR
jgi:hypothetical protein